MPELPEVESVRRGLQQLVTNKIIESVKVDWPRMVVTPLPITDWQDQLANQQIKAVARRGKYLIFYLDDQALISHLRMEGKYQYFTAEEIQAKGNWEKDKHTHVRFMLTDHSQLHYHDVRKFGRFELISKEEVENYFENKKIGPEPTKEAFQLEDFAFKLSTIKRAIKPALLDQKIVAGLGNIYVDEVLFQAKIHPATPAQLIGKNSVRNLHQAIIDILGRAVEAGGSSVRTYVNSLGEAGRFQEQLKVYGKKGQTCINCGQVIEKIQLAQRGTHFCPYCQQLELEGEGDD